MPGDSFDAAAFNARPELDEVKYFHVHLGESKDDDGNVVSDDIRIPPMRRWKQRAIDNIAAGQITEAIRTVLSEEDSALLESYDWELGTYEALFEALSKWSGFQTGPASAPPPGRGLTPRSS